MLRRRRRRRRRERRERREFYNKCIKFHVGVIFSPKKEV
jgi:hypothetical protein